MSSHETESESLIPAYFYDPSFDIEKIALEALSTLRKHGQYAYTPTEGVIPDESKPSFVHNYVRPLLPTDPKDTMTQHKSPQAKEPRPVVATRIKLPPVTDQDTKVTLKSSFKPVVPAVVKVITTKPKPKAKTRVKTVTRPIAVPAIEPKHNLETKKRVTPSKPAIPPTKKITRKDEAFILRQAWLEQVDPEAKRKALEKAQAKSSESTIAYGTSENAYVSKMLKHPILTRSQEIDLAKRIEKGDLAAKEKLVSHNFKRAYQLAIPIAKANDMPVIDLFEEGVLGLIRAAEKFDYRRGYKFSTYATFWIKQACQRAADDKARTIRVPIHMVADARKLTKTKRILEVKNKDQEPSDELLAKETGFTLEKVKGIHRVLSLEPTSLDAPVKKDETNGTSFGALISNGERPVDSVAISKTFSVQVAKYVNDLPEHEAIVINMKHGINGYTEMDTAEAAASLGISAATVRQRYHVALEKLKILMIADGFTGEDE